MHCLAASPITAIRYASMDHTARSARQRGRPWINDHPPAKTTCARFWKPTATRPKPAANCAGQIVCLLSSSINVAFPCSRSRTLRAGCGTPLDPARRCSAAEYRALLGVLPAGYRRSTRKRSRRRALPIRTANTPEAPLIPTTYAERIPQPRIRRGLMLYISLPLPMLFLPWVTLRQRRSSGQSEPALAQPNCCRARPLPAQKGQ